MTAKQMMAVASAISNALSNERADKERGKQSTPAELVLRAVVAGLRAAARTSDDGTIAPEDDE